MALDTCNRLYLFSHNDPQISAIIFSLTTLNVIDTKIAITQQYMLTVSTCVESVQLCDLNVTGSHQPHATRHIDCVLLVNSPKKLNLLSWLLIYLC